MGANITIYCLEKLTDYAEFERLCSDLMIREGFSNLEPLGNFKDKGRDAIHIDEKQGTTTIFAYSVREDWQAKLFEDAAKVKKHGHKCDQLVFLTTANFSAGERDIAIARIKADFGWRLQLYGVERLRVLLDGKHPDLKHSHPHIFPPRFFQHQEPSEEKTTGEFVVILADKADRVFSEWLARKLTSEEYLVWYEYTENISGQIVSYDIEEAIRQAFCVLAVISQEALNNADLTHLRLQTLAQQSGQDSQKLVPVLIEGVDSQQLDRKTRELRSASFVSNWAHGLRQLIQVLDVIGCPHPLGEGPMLAIRSYLPKETLTYEPEEVISNCLRVIHIPDVIYLYEFSHAVPWDTYKFWKQIWAFRSLTPQKFLSFHTPPATILDGFSPKRIDSFLWRTGNEIHGIVPRNLVSELLGKTVEVHCAARGLKFYSRDNGYYFPDGLLNNNIISFNRPDGKKSRVNVVGERKFFKPHNSSFIYRYHLSPSFRVRQDLFDDFVLILNVRVQFTTQDHQRFEKSSNNTLRKHLTKDWWNRQWLYRILAIAHYLGDGGDISVGEGDEQISISSEPIRFTTPYGIG